MEIGQWRPLFCACLFLPLLAWALAKTPLCWGGEPRSQPEAPEAWRWLQVSPLLVFVTNEFCVSSCACLHPLVHLCDFSSVHTVWWVALLLLNTEPG